MILQKYNHDVSINSTVNFFLKEIHTGAENETGKC